jgi:PAS domain S-box-containing protein
MVVAALSTKSREKQAYFDTLSAVQKSADATVTKTVGGFITSWNAAAEKLFGFSAEDAIGESIEIIVPDGYRSELRHILERIGRGEIVALHETVRLTKDGERIKVALSIAPIKSPSGAIIGACKIEPVPVV